MHINNNQILASPANTDTQTNDELSISTQERLPSTPSSSFELAGLPPRKKRKMPETSRSSNVPKRQVVVSNRLIDPKKPAAVIPSLRSVLFVSNAGVNVNSPQAEGTGGGLVPAVASVAKLPGNFWLFTNKKVSEVFTVAENTFVDGGKVRQFPLSHKQHIGFYEEFANQVIWPACHYRADLIMPAPKIETYREVNDLFALQVIDRLNVAPDSIVLIQDYHHMVLPKILREKGIENPIGYFHHIPIPTPAEAYKMPNHKELMSSLLSCDLVGLQTNNDVENFCNYVKEHLEGTTVRLEDGSYDVIVSGKATSVKSFPIGIDVPEFLSGKTDENDRALLTKVENEVTLGRTVIGGVDREDWTKDILGRLQAYADLLEVNPSLYGQLVFVQVAAPSRSDLPAYKEAHDEIAKLVAEINNKYGTKNDHGTTSWTPVIYHNELVSRASLPELFRLIDIYVASSPWDGQHLGVKEFAAAQGAGAPGQDVHPGVMVMSTGVGASEEFSQTSEQFRQRSMFPSGDIPALAVYLRSLIGMTKEERKEMSEKIRESVNTYNVHGWLAPQLEFLSMVNRPSDKLCDS
ncbi:alpha,alpha-trehalose-phosphate synthase (UDP-forming) [Collimonas fungivorans]|uniref:Alpha,alpha-trehalose-phosphate synthase (UDP-forming) n=1 Tax=Collimonas fungivorans (strain Ter331) TaxID=1005048 RepID=G0ADJ7_COLFT|nr:trehalose-6-phosphate synthase [Collimonas fungivorans]AEK63539.1 Alpha,alpha-trehalose-phosphate synthase (UDP-forming) [Collimonas fungivorans Ter331]